MTDPQLFSPDGRPRARSLGIAPAGRPGPWNAITDVPGVEVGYRTVIFGEGPLRVGAGPARTGVTAILPRGRDGVGRPCAAGWYSLNGNGEMTGTAWIDEVGQLSMPITISNTHAIGPCHAGVVEWINRAHPALAREWLLPVCAETWDGYLNDINGGHITPALVAETLDAARTWPLLEGSVGGGTGMNCYGFKGGTGTASRQLPFGPDTYTVGVLIQANFGAREELTIAGHRLGAALTTDNPQETTPWHRAPGDAASHRAQSGVVGGPVGTATHSPEGGSARGAEGGGARIAEGRSVRGPEDWSAHGVEGGSARDVGGAGRHGGVWGSGDSGVRVPGGAGSVIVIVATDAPLDALQCKAMARRVPFGLARTGTTGSLFSGDLFLAFSTASDRPSDTGFPRGEPSAEELVNTPRLPWNRMDAFYTAVVEAVEESVLNALIVNSDMTGRDGHRSPALPHDRLRELLGR
ncbi:P1 family peptidase [Nocardia sp. NPDC059240]|uniref:DmpA family aminopeptidase n=1 Tax=Nocardia sp. NPDC059240 TaxID=3346786 RepID=UPI0036BD1E2A